MRTLFTLYVIFFASPLAAQSIPFAFWRWDVPLGTCFQNEGPMAETDFHHLYLAGLIPETWDAEIRNSYLITGAAPHDAELLEITENGFKKIDVFPYRRPTSDGLPPEFGRSVSLSPSAKYFIIGANLGKGSAYIFYNGPAGWAEQKKLQPSDLPADADFGYKVAMNDNIAVVSTEIDTVYVFKRSGTDWIKTKLLTGSGRFGASVAISDSYVFIGDWDNDLKDANAGAVFVYRMDDTGNLIDEGPLFGSDIVVSDHFGKIVEVDGDTLVVTSLTLAGQGAAYIFVFDGTKWVEKQKIDPPAPLSGDRFGASANINGDHLIIGAPFDSSAASKSGAVYVYVNTESGWVLSKRIPDHSPYGNGRFGSAVGISGNSVFVGGWGILENTGEPAGIGHFYQMSCE